MTEAVSFEIAPDLENNIVLPAYEKRLIYVFQGIQFTNKELSDDDHSPDRLPNCLLKTKQEKVVRRWAPSSVRAARRFPGVDEEASPPAGVEFVEDKLVRLGERRFTFTSPLQMVKYDVRLVEEKSELRLALARDHASTGDKEVKGIGVVYAGHSRYGRGACFGTDTSPGEWWHDGTGEGNGLFRIAYPLVAIPLREIMEHGYSFKPCEASYVIRNGDCHPHVRRRSLRAVNLRDEFDKELKALLRRDRSYGSALSSAQMSASFSNSKRYWGYSVFDREEDESSARRYVLLHAGWTSTPAAPHDLGATKLACKVFCHFGCDSSVHFESILRDRKGWRSDANQGREAYFTSASSYEILPYWLYYLFTYPRRNAFQAWGPCLDYAAHSTNGKLKKIELEERMAPPGVSRYSYRYRIVSGGRQL
jgi:hypothetical protein